MYSYKIWARIDGKDYPVTYGSSYTDCLSETLDSGSIILAEIPGEPLTIRPFMDVILHSPEIWTGEPGENEGEVAGEEVVWCPNNHALHTIYTQGTCTIDNPHSKFYRHMLIESPQRQQVALDKYFNYTLPVVSETKGLEFVILPNRTITQPKVDDVVVVSQQDFDDAFKSVYWWMDVLVKTYSPWIKVTDDGETFRIERKYFLSQDCIAKFDSIKCPEMVFQENTLREALTKLMNVADCIPVVHDGMITFLDLSARNKSFAERRRLIRQAGFSPEDYPSLNPAYDNNEEGIMPNQSWRNWVMSGGEYADRLRTTYQGALSDKNATRYVEKMGFRNFDKSQMNMADLRLEFSHPIYKINKIYLEYYKKTIDKEKAFLVKYDITPFVKLNSERGLLSHDWTDIRDSNVVAWSKEQLAKYYFFTVGYDIGQKFIGGWGEKNGFSRDGILSAEHSVIENLMVICELKSYYGDAEYRNDLYYLAHREDTDIWNVTEKTAIAGIEWSDGGLLGNGLSSLNDNGLETVFQHLFGQTSNHPFNSYEAFEVIAKNMVTPAGRDPVQLWFSSALKTIVNFASGWVVGSPALTDWTPQLKSVFFEVEYEGLISGAVITSKDYHDGDVVRKDAVSQSLSVIETAGAFEKQKVNKLGNASIIVSQRIQDERMMFELGDYDPQDYIIYQRTVSYRRDYIQVTYYLCKDYVLKNYFVSVFSKIRPFALSSYNESVQRDENHYQCALISTNKSYYENETKSFTTTYNETTQEYRKYGFKPSDAVSFLIENVPETYPFEVIEHFLSYMHTPDTRVYDGAEVISGFEDKNYELEYQPFISGTSICFAFTMPDSVSANTYILQWNPSINQYIYQKYDLSNDAINNGYTGIEDMVAHGYEVAGPFLQDLSGTVQNWHMFQDSYEPLDISFHMQSISLNEKQDVFGDGPDSVHIIDVDAGALYDDETEYKFTFDGGSTINTYLFLGSSTCNLDVNHNGIAFNFANATSDGRYKSFVKTNGFVLFTTNGIFDLLDVNKDGVVTEDEIDAILNRTAISNRVNQSGSNPYSFDRTGLETLADVDELVKDTPIWQTPGFVDNVAANFSAFNVTPTSAQIMEAYVALKCTYILVCYLVALTIRDKYNGRYEMSGSIYNRLMKLPLDPYNVTVDDARLHFVDTYKDQKEKINSIAQLELIGDNSDVFVTQYAAVINEMVGNKMRNWVDVDGKAEAFWIMASTYALADSVQIQMGSSTSSLRFYNENYPNNAFCGFYNEYQTSHRKYSAYYPMILVGSSEMMSGSLANRTINVSFNHTWRGFLSMAINGRIANPATIVKGKYYKHTLHINSIQFDANGKANIMNGTLTVYGSNDDYEMYNDIISISPNIGYTLQWPLIKFNDAPAEGQVINLSVRGRRYYYRENAGTSNTFRYISESRQIEFIEVRFLGDTPIPTSVYTVQSTPYGRGFEVTFDQSWWEGLGSDQYLVFFFKYSDSITGDGNTKVFDLCDYDGHPTFSGSQSVFLGSQNSPRKESSNSFIFNLPTMKKCDIAEEQLTNTAAGNYVDLSSNPSIFSQNGYFISTSGAFQYNPLTMDLLMQDDATFALDKESSPLFMDIFHPTVVDPNESSLPNVTTASSIMIETAFANVKLNLANAKQDLCKSAASSNYAYYHDGKVRFLNKDGIECDIVDSKLGQNLFLVHDTNRLDMRDAELLSSFAKEIVDGHPVWDSNETEFDPLTIKINNLSVGENGYLYQNVDGQTIIKSNIADSIDERGKVTITAETDLPDTTSGGSIRIYYFDNNNVNGLFHLVFASNSYEIENGVLTVTFYVSILDNRSKTVFDRHGDPVYEIVNYATDTDYDITDHINYCKPKQ